MSAEFDFVSVLRAMPARCLVMLPDQRFTILDASDRFLRDIGMARDELVGRGLFEVFPAARSGKTRDLLARWHAALEEIRHTMDAQHLPAQHFGPSPSRGETRWVPVLFPVVNANGELEALLQQMDDVPQPIVIDKTEIRLAQAAAEHASLVKDEFLSTLSHELRTPLNTILGWTQVLQRSTDFQSDKTISALATIERSARQQARLIDDLLDASAIMAGKVHLDLRPVRSRDVIVSSVDVCNPAALARNIRIDTVIDDTSTAIEADASRLQQVVCRLLSNAIKFSANGGVITVHQATSANKVVITITDNGQGIAPAFLPSLFARFSQADGSSTRSHMGLGLGLSIVKSLVSLHGGHVSATSQGIQQGATFTIDLPLLLTDLAPLSVSSDGHPVEDSDEWHADIVLVDDEPDAGVVLQEILQNAGATVRLAFSATEALQMIDERRPDLMISDIGMPNIDGYQLLRLLRQQEPADHPPIPAIALTAFARPEDKRRAIDAGYLIHFAKPVESADLVTAVKLAIRRPSRMLRN
ncbi:hybrid sensor histidine kinase/response regulator [Actimicrobium antarcticum]|uniref:histidine kinase n=1 Tax=Actimicrobium antarcticum TaxID=1051899 RepID=A0ABP7SW31_9BURK